MVGLGSDNRNTISTLIEWAGMYCWRGRGVEGGVLASEAYVKLLTVWQGRDQLEGFTEAQRFVTSASAAGAD